MKKHTLLQRLLPLAMLAAMLARAAGLAANEERADAFADAASIPAWARGSVGGGDRHAEKRDRPRQRDRQGRRPRPSWIC